MSSEAPYGAVRVMYFLRIPNIGDMASPHIVNSLSKHPAQLCRTLEEPHLFCIGSILGGGGNMTITWGTGVMDPGSDLSRLQASNIYSVRGKLTHAELSRAGVPVADVPLGDPGYLVPELFPGQLDRRYRLGFIPHYVDRLHPLFQRLSREDDVLDINVHTPVEHFFRALRSCDAVVSSSLHGLIFAEAMGIPNLWIKLSDRAVRTGFKFRDWFSLAQTPQAEPYEPTGLESSMDLIQQSRLHDMQIDKCALRASFPMSRMEELTIPISNQTFIPTSDCRQKPLPIFIISYNRAAYLRKAVDSYRRMNRPVAIIIRDNGSDDPATIALLGQLKHEGCIVHYCEAISEVGQLDRVNETIQIYFRDWAEPSRYVVTDCDIDLSIAAASALDVYDELLNRYTSVQCVGPMLRIHDIPKEYPLLRHTLNRHIGQFWQNKPEWINTAYGRVASQECVIDTTFALHRAGEAFTRLKTARRVYHPFEARHLDWYLSPEEMPLTAYFDTASIGISHWGTRAALERMAREELEFDHYIAVSENEDGQLSEVVHWIEK